MRDYADMAMKLANEANDSDDFYADEIVAASDAMRVLDTQVREWE